MNNLLVVIMAGGMGKRMNSSLPKVLHKINNEPMLVKIIKEVEKLNPKKILVIAGVYLNTIKEHLSKYLDINTIEFVLQSQALGTGHAVKCCSSIFNDNSNTNTLILSGDTPLISNTLLNAFFNDFNNIKIMTTYLEKPYGYGRIKENNHKFDKIIEEKDCNNDEKLIKKVNCGIYFIKTKLLYEYLPLLKNNNMQKEFYLTDIVEIIKNEEKIDIESYIVPFDKQMEVKGVNTVEELCNLEKEIINNTIY